MQMAGSRTQMTGEANTRFGIQTDLGAHPVRDLLHGCSRTGCAPTWNRGFVRAAPHALANPVSRISNPGNEGAR